jgi:hypothetical protein
MSEKKYSAHAEAEKAHFFSCRHRDRAACDKARQAWEARQHSKVDGAAVRRDLRAKLSAAEQIVLLDQRLGAGVGAVRERARLAKP